MSNLFIYSYLCQIYLCLPFQWPSIILDATKLCLHYCYPLSPQLKCSFHLSSPMLHLHCPFTLRVFFSSLHHPFFTMPYPIHFPLTLSKFPFPHVRLSWSSFPVCFTLAGLGACSRGALCQNKHTRFHLLGQRLCTHFLQRLAFSLPLPQSLEFCLIPSFPSLSLGFTRQLGMAPNVWANFHHCLRLGSTMP